MLTVESAISQFESFLKNFHLPEHPRNLYKPIEYMIELGGKRLRPTLLLIANDMLRGEIAEALPAAGAIEWFHNFTLMHDDIMDCANIRRGKPSVQKKYNVNTAILSGDVMLIKVYDLLLATPEKYRYKIIKEFNKVAVLVCEGQQLDMDFESSLDVSAEDYLDMIGKKTAALLAGSLKIGAILGGADEKIANSFYDFGYHLGVAFQLKDDYLDAFGDAEVIGKQQGGDILMNKKTYLLIKALETAKGNEAESLNRLLNDHDENKVKEVLSLYKSLETDRLTIQQIHTHHEKAISKLEYIPVDEERKKVFRHYAAQLLERKS